MAIRTRIKEVAQERGIRPIEIARRLKLYRSNLSLMDAGRRSISLSALAKVAEVLGCEPGELLQTADIDNNAVFRSAALNARLAQRDSSLADGTEKGWVHSVLLSWQRHYKAARK